MKAGGCPLDSETGDSDTDDGKRGTACAQLKLVSGERP